VLSRIIWGARASIQAGVLATVLAIVIAVPIGIAAGYYRGVADPVIARLADVLLAFPFLVLAVGLAAIFGPSLTNATRPLVDRTPSPPAPVEPVPPWMVPLFVIVRSGAPKALRPEPPFRPS